MTVYYITRVTEEKKTSFCTFQGQLPDLLNRDTKVINSSAPLPTTNRLTTETPKLANVRKELTEGRCHFIGGNIQCVREHWELWSCSDEDRSIPKNEESGLGETLEEIAMGQRC